MPFLVEIPNSGRLEVRASGGRYVEKKVQIADREREWWIRKPWEIKSEFTAPQLLDARLLTPRVHNLGVPSIKSATLATPFASVAVA